MPSAEAKMRTLAQQSSILQSYFGGANGTFRWFDRQLQPGYITAGACVRVLRVSTLRMYAKETRTRRSVSEQAQPRFQLDVLDYSAERARAAASAICDWLATVDFSSANQFTSPATTPTRHPNFVLNQRAGMEFQLQPPAYVESLDIRIFDLESAAPQASILILTSGASWAGVRTDGAPITVEAIGGGGGGANGTIDAAGVGGGGGAYARISVPYTSGTPVSGIVIGAGGDAGIPGTDTVWNGGVVVAKGGGGGSGLTAGVGGDAASCTPTTGAYSGGTGGAVIPNPGGGTGGGGAAGPKGAGKDGGPNGTNGAQNSGGGGGGAGGGSSTAGATPVASNPYSAGAEGGDAQDGTAGGAGGAAGAPNPGTAGSHGSGGGGGSGILLNSMSDYHLAIGGAGGNGIEWDATHGAGGGGGAGGGSQREDSLAANGGNGGLYGGGGAGGGYGGDLNSGMGGTGGDGIIVISYFPPE